MQIVLTPKAVKTIKLKHLLGFDKNRNFPNLQDERHDVIAAHDQKRMTLSPGMAPAAVGDLVPRNKLMPVLLRTVQQEAKGPELKSMDFGWVKLQGGGAANKTDAGFTVVSYRPICWRLGNIPNEMGEKTT